MMRQQIAAILGMLVVVGTAVSLVFLPDSSASWPELRSATKSPARVEIDVGRNVHVSRSRPWLRHAECVIAADPGDPKRLFSSAMLWRKGDDPSLVGYYSHDGGTTWHVGFERDPAAAGERYCDETVEYGPDGKVYLAYMRFQLIKKGGGWESPPLGPDVEGGGAVEFQRSTDGGRTWEGRGIVRRHIDRPWLCFDRTDGPRRGRLYWCGQVTQLLFGASADEARTLEPLIIAKPAIRGITLRPTQPVVLSDGSVVFAIHSNPDRGSGPPHIDVFRSDDGGKTLQQVGRVPGPWRHARLRANAHCINFFPQLAVSGSRTRHRDRLYCVWHDGCVILSRSDDRGKTWTPPRVISEQPIDEPGGDYTVCMPTVAVNSDGVVAVGWYDSRTFPSKPGKGGGLWTSGYDVRLRASLDGGETWGPSVKVNEKSARADVHEYGHTAGLAAAADGRFFPAWIDNRTGRPQLWCAPCTVRGAK